NVVPAWLPLHIWRSDGAHGGNCNPRRARCEECEHGRTAGPAACVSTRGRRGLPSGQARRPWSLVGRMRSVEAQLADQLEREILRSIEVAVDGDRPLAPVAAALDAETEHLDTDAAHHADVPAAVAVVELDTRARLLQVPREDRAAIRIEREPVLAARPDVEPKQCRNLDRARFEVESVGLHIAFEIDEFTGEAEQAALVAAEPE